MTNQWANKLSRGLKTEINSCIYEYQVQEKERYGMKKEHDS